MPLYDDFENPNGEIDYFGNESDFSFETPILPD